MKLIRKALDDALHQVLLSNDILTTDDLVDDLQTTAKNTSKDLFSTAKCLDREKCLI